MSRFALVPRPGTEHAVLTPPLSKSDAQRALVLAYVAGHPEWAALDDDDADLAGDINVMRRGLATLYGSDPQRRTIDCHDGGTPFRLLVGQAAVRPGVDVRFTGTPRLGQRPHEPLFAALEGALGASGLRLTRGAPWPLDVHGIDAPSRGTVLSVSSSESSQYATSLLCVAAALCVREGRAFTVALTGARVSAGYLDLTIDWLRRTGFDVVVTAAHVIVERWAAPVAAPTVPGDWSSLGYLLVTAWRTGAAVSRVDLAAAHPDRAIVEVLAEAGVALTRNSEGNVVVTGTPTRGIVGRGNAHPDLLLTLAALACVLPGPSTFHDTSVLTQKESDRRAALLALARAAGATATHHSDDTIILVPGVVPRTCFVSARSDHRVAMSLAVLAVLSGARVMTDDVACVAKSFPGFWRELAKVGLDVVREEDI